MLTKESCFRYIWVMFFILLNLNTVCLLCLLCLSSRSWFRMQRMLGPQRLSFSMMRQSMEWNHCGHMIWLSTRVWLGDLLNQIVYSFKTSHNKLNTYHVRIRLYLLTISCGFRSYIAIYTFLIIIFNRKP